MKNLFIILFFIAPLFGFGQITNAPLYAGGVTALNTASGSVTDMRRPGTYTDCSSSLANFFQIGDGSGRVELCVTDLSNISTLCGGGNNKDDYIEVWTDQNANGVPETSYTYFSPSGMFLNTQGTDIGDSQNCVMSPIGSGYLWLTFCPEGSCSAADKLESRVSFTWRSFPNSVNDLIADAATIDQCDQGFSANNFSASNNGCFGTTANLGPPSFAVAAFYNDLDCDESGTNLGLATAPYNEYEGDVGYSVENDLWYTFSPLVTGTWTLTLSMDSCYASNGISSGPDAGDFYSSGYQFALFEGSSTQLSTLISGGTNGQNLTNTQTISISVTNTTSTYYLQVEGFAGTGCTFEASISQPPSLDCALVLPINLLSFDAKASGTNVIVDWRTASEINNDYFSIERSRDNITFETIGTQPGSGNSSTERNYSFKDEHPFIGLNYYRLRQTDFDGAFEYFDPRAVYVGEYDLELNLTPYEGGQYVLVTTAPAPSNSVLTIYDLNGKIVHHEMIELNVGTNHTIISLSKLKDGLYSCRLSGDHTTNSLKFVKF